MIFEQVKSILSEQLEIDESEITLDSLLFDDLGADSLDLVDMAMTVEDVFSVELPVEMLETVQSVKDVVDFLEQNT